MQGGSSPSFSIGQFFRSVRNLDGTGVALVPTILPTPSIWTQMLFEAWYPFLELKRLTPKTTITIYGVPLFLDIPILVFLVLRVPILLSKGPSRFMAVRNPHPDCATEVGVDSFGLGILVGVFGTLSTIAAVLRLGSDLPVVKTVLGSHFGGF